MDYRVTDAFRQEPDSIIINAHCPLTVYWLQISRHVTLIRLHIRVTDHLSSAAFHLSTDVVETSGFDLRYFHGYL
jgi:hypothetical protein